ncbi:MAG: (Fe-S)-binding protein [Caldilineaceae bacterium]|nr:(Fe-S)-binding protein [Caldilineaceae bacterium]
MTAKKTFPNPPRRVALFVTCMVDMLYPEVGMATVELLEKQGIEVVFPEAQTCCGQPAFNAGFRDEARVLARRFVDIFEPLVISGQVDAVVAPSGSCVTMVTHFYDALFESESAVEYRYRAANLAAATFELTEFLVDVLGVTDVKSRFDGKLTYHASCHLLRELGVDRQPRALLENVAGAELVPLDGADECCGFGGLFAIKNGPISTAMGERKAANIIKSGADAATLCDVSCMTHINGLLSRQQQRCRVVHIAQVLNNQVDVADSPDASRADVAAPEPSRRWQDAREEK